MGLFSKDSKFSAQLFEQACTLMGLDAENTTEAELHQAMVDAGTIQQHAQGTAAATAQAQIDAAKADAVRLTAELAAANEATQTANAELETLRAENAQATADLNTANAALAASVKERNTLAAEVARLTAGKAPKGSDATDDDPQFEKAPTGNGVTVKADWLETAMLGKKPTAN